MSIIGQATAYARFALGLRRFLQEPVTASAGREEIRCRLRDRSSSFVTLVRRAIYENQSSPYLALLRGAGCEYGDVERMVSVDGVESTLERLRDSGVYVTIDEFKGRKDIVRGSLRLRCTPEAFDNPFLLRSIATSSSGSRGAGTRTAINLQRSRYNSLCTAAAFSAHGIAGLPTVLWMPVLPSAAGLAMLLHASKMGVPPVKWFSPVASRAIRPSLTKRLATLYVVYAGRVFGTRMPLPEYVSADQAYRVADTVLNVLRHSRGCVVFCTPSSAVRVCREIQLRRVDLHGVAFIVSGEPLTPAKRAEIAAAGATAVNLYAFSEGGVVGFGCAAGSTASDDVHVLLGSQAVISRPREAPFGGGRVEAFLFTSLMDKAAKILLNVESGDYGVIDTRGCGCELGALGLTRHLHTVRSFDKLTGEGMTFVGTDLLRVVEEVLPQTFGGSSTDYQMVETEDLSGATVLQIVVSPGVGAVDEALLSEVVLRELGSGGETNRMMAEMWRQGRVLKVCRENPHITRGGKLLPLHILHGGGR